MSIEHIGILIGLVLIGLAAFALIAFGIRNLFYGKHRVSTILIVLLPLVLLGVLGTAMADWDYALILTAVIMLGLGALGLIFSSIRGVLGL